MGKGARECRTETERCQHAQKENDVSRRSKEDCRRSTSAMGEGEGCPKEVRLKRNHLLRILPSAGQPTNVSLKRGLAAKTRKRFSCPKNVLLLYCRPSTWQVFPAFNERSKTPSKPASTLVFLVFLTILSTIVSAVGISGCGSNPT